jgi:predicted N-acetyltransferase YhbS
MIIRLETQEDFSKIYELVKIAFQTAAVTSGHEQDFVNELRSGDHYIPELALVAEEDGQLVGHSMLTKARIVGESGEHEILFLGPLSVVLEKRKTGIGSALIAESFKRARELGYTSVILAGDPAYYSRFGFKSCGSFGITYEGVPDPYAMAYELTPDGLKGVHGILAH